MQHMSVWVEAGQGTLGEAGRQEGRKQRGTQDGQRPKPKTEREKR